MNRLRVQAFFGLFSLLAVAGCSTTSENSKDYKSAKVHTELASLYYQRAQMGVALEELKQALNADSEYAPAYGVRGLVNMALREDKDAEADFRKSLSLDDTDSDTHNNYGWFLCQRGREKEAIPQFMAALKNPLYTTPGRAYLNAGLCSQKAGNNKDAEDFLKRALDVDPGLTQAMYALAGLSFAEGDYYAARQYFIGFAQSANNLTADQLWLGVRISRQTGDRAAEAKYSMQLRNLYPGSQETRMLMGDK
jgi:type IV pilus assembly protein PilF